MYTPTKSDEQRANEVIQTKSMQMQNELAEEMNEQRFEVAKEIQQYTEEFSELLAKLADEAVKGIAEQLRKAFTSEISQLLPTMIQHIHSKISGGVGQGMTQAYDDIVSKIPVK